MEEKITERIRKLLAKAEGTDNQDEADTFMRAAMTMMARHQLDEAAVRAGMGQDASPPGIVRAEWTFSNADGLGLVRGGGGSDISTVFGCSCLIQNHLKPDVPWTLIIYGTQDATDAALMVIRSLSVQWETAALRAWNAHADLIRERERAELEYQRYQDYRPPLQPIPRPGDYYSFRDGPSPYSEPLWHRDYGRPPQPDPLTPQQQILEDVIGNSQLLGLPTAKRGFGYRGHPDQARSGYMHPDLTPERRTTFMGSFIGGFITHAVERLKGAQQEVEQESPGAGLVLKSDADRAQAARDTAYPNLDTAKRQANDYAAYVAGRQAGAGADLGGTRFGYGDRAPRGIGM
jgi:Protein of unknown function (DUF2786)